MPTDYEIYKLRMTEFKDVKQDSDVARILAERFNMSSDGLRGTISRSKTLEHKLKLAKELRDVDPTNPSVITQRRIIQESIQDFNYKQSRLELLDRMAVGVFLSDKHNPYSRHDAWTLVAQILDDMPHVDYISVQNDWNDYHGWGRWEDKRPPKERVWSSDIAYCDRMEAHDYDILDTVAPDAMKVAIMGNHDRWLYEFYRQNVPQGSEAEIARRMEWMYDLGVKQFTRGFHENALHLSPNLVWVHGKWAAKRSTSNARNAVRKFTKDGVSSCVVFGHTHRSSIVEGRDIDINGIKVVNNPSLCRNTGLEFIDLGEAVNWTLGFTVCYFEPHTRKVRFDMIEFATLGNELVAHANGKVYSTELDNHQYDDTVERVHVRDYIVIPQ